MLDCPIKTNITIASTEPDGIHEYVTHAHSTRSNGLRVKVTVSDLTTVTFSNDGAPCNRADESLEKALSLAIVTVIEITPISVLFFSFLFSLSFFYRL